LLQLRISDCIDDEEYQVEKNNREEKILMLKQSIQEEESNPVNILADIENKIKGLVNLEERFNEASEKGRRKMFLDIGENHLLNGKELNIIKPLWLQTVQKNIKVVEPELVRFELEKYLDAATFNLYFRDMFPLMCALVEEVRTEISKEAKDIRQ
jgi:hypothetical protein